MKKSLIACLPAFIWGIAIFVFTVLPAFLAYTLLKIFKGHFKSILVHFLPLYKDHFSCAFKHIDKVAHFSEYTILAFLVVCGLNYVRGITIRANLSITLFFGISYGLITEHLQKYIPSRTASFGDAMANVAGVLFGIVLGYLVIGVIKLVSGKFRNCSRKLLSPQTSSI